MHAVENSPGSDRSGKIHIDPSALALEIISIVVAILLAFTLNYLGGRISNHNNIQRSLRAISAEMAANQTSINHFHAHHVAKCAILSELADHGRDHVVTYTNYINALNRVMPFAPSPTQNIAWQLAETSGTSVNFDYSTRADLARVYQQQEQFERLGDNLSSDFRPLVFTRDDDFFLVARNAALDCSNITHSEERLVTIYDMEIRKMNTR
jgi:hypothetical protein